MGNVLSKTIRSMELVKGFIRLVGDDPEYRRFPHWYARHGSWIPRFRDSFAGEDCFLIGNGPSLNKVELPRLNDYHCIGLNKIHLLLERVPLRLAFHVAVNPLVIEQSWKEFLKLDCPSFVSYEAAKAYIKSSHHIHYLLTEHRITPRFSRIYDEAVWEGWTVTYVALQLAYFMGFRNVFLIGVDHDFKVRGQPNEQQDLAADDANHFDPRYFAGCTWHLPDLEASECSYRMARFAFERSGRRIWDATVGGKCQIFQKIDIEEAFRTCKQRS